MCNRILRWIGTFSLILASEGLHAQVPQGMAPCRIPIFIWQTGMGGMSTIYNGQPVILIDPQVATGDAMFLTFTINHECGHHVHGDILANGLNQNANIRPELELRADCYAAGRVSKSVSRHVAMIFRQTQGGQSPAPGYPTGNERASNILRCADLAEDDEDESSASSESGDCPGLPDGMSLTCKFTRGPRRGEVQNFCGTGAAPAPVGGPCTDGRGSFGSAQ